MVGTLNQEPGVHAHHVGSLLRPKALRDAVKARRLGRIADSQLRQVQDECIRKVIQQQERLGLEVVTDGEFRRPSYWMHWVEHVDGLEVDDARFHFQDHSGLKRSFTAPSVVGELRRVSPISSSEYSFSAAVTPAFVKMTMPSPSTFLFWRGEATLPSDVYSSSDAFFDDLCNIYREEIADLAALGCKYIQLDEVPLIMLADPEVRRQSETRGEAPDRLADQFINAINCAISERPSDMVAAVHMCRGNYKGGWLSEGGYDAIATRAFHHLEVDVFLLEYDNWRAGDFGPLQFVPPSRRVVLGLVNSKTAELEDREILRNRIELASKYFPIERLAISPQCGFASTAGGNPITAEVQEEKLRLVVETAREVWG